HHRDVPRVHPRSRHAALLRRELALGDDDSPALRRHPLSPARREPPQGGEPDAGDAPRHASHAQRRGVGDRGDRDRVPLEALLMAKPAPKGDDALTRRSDAWTDLALTLPIFLIYHLGVVFLSIRNAADPVTTELQRLADHSLLMYAVLTVAIGVAFVAVVA